MCAKLVKAMYGTRDAAQHWEITYRKAHEEWGFEVGRASPCVMYHPPMEIWLVVHGADFTALGWEAELDWYRGILTGRFEAKVKRNNWYWEGDEKTMRVLNRMLHWTESGIEYEVD